MRLLRQRPFALLFIGSALNAIGTWATLLALWGYASYRFHAGPNGIALLGLAWAVPGAVLSPLAGLPVDRFGPKRVLVLSDVLGFATAVAMAFAGGFSTLVVLALGSGAVQAFGAPAAMSLPARLVRDEELLTANALLSAAEQSAIVFGPVVASVAISLWDIRAAFLFDAATFVVGGLAVAPLVLRPVASARRTSLRRDLLDGLRHARATPEVSVTLGLAAAVFFSWGAFFVLEPLYVRDVLHGSAALLGLFQTVFGIGLVTAGLLLPRLGERVVSVRYLAGSVTVSGVAAALYVGTRSPVVAALGVFLWGVDVAFFIAPMQTVLQRATPVEAHGRVLALAGTADSWGNVLAIPLTGVAVGALGVSATGWVAGGLALVAGAVGLAVCGRGRLSTPAPMSVPLAG